MAYPFEEDFASGIPSGFASIGGSGGVTVTWNEAQQAAAAEEAAAVQTVADHEATQATEQAKPADQAG